MNKDPLKISLLIKLPFQIAFAAAMLYVIAWFARQIIDLFGGKP